MTTSVFQTHLNNEPMSSQNTQLTTVMGTQLRQCFASVESGGK